jgi:DNA-binding CsgD family transcriptional regulator
MSAGSVAALMTLGSLPVNVAILDAAGVIVAVNPAWTEFGRSNGLRLPRSGIGADYLRYAAGGGPDADRLVGDLRQLLAGRRELVTAVYPCHSPDQQRWFSLVGAPLSPDPSAGVAILHIDLTRALPLPPPPPPVHGPQPAGGDAAAGLETVGEIIARSASEALSSQLSAMFAASGPRPARAPAAPPGALAALTRRQMQVLRLLGEGRTNGEIAQALSRSPNTVKLHVSAILQRLNLKSRTQAALLASNLASPAPPD